MQTDNHSPPAGRDVGGMVMAVVFILVAAVSLWDTTTMADADSYVFPRAIAIAMIAFSIALIVWNLVRPSPDDGSPVEGASTPRRVGLVAAMLIATALMPYVGFVISGLAVFAAIMGFAMYDPWTRFRVIVYPLVGAGIVVGFYAIFAELLLVPLPTGLLFD
ncbi:MAG: tripartite tricarboxylate transporter TctB family protein [Gammaproteobacteria bacterium]|nr:tripartite tricarboxylate transporter TctB family protein [Gammaproteobacteria bacterium]